MKALQKIIQPLLIIAAIVAGVVAIKAFFMPVQATKESYRGKKYSK